MIFQFFAVFSATNVRALYISRFNYSKKVIGYFYCYLSKFVSL